MVLKSTVWISPAFDVPELKAITNSDEVRYKAGLGVPLSADGNDPPTHYGEHGWTEKRVRDFLKGANQPTIKGRTKASVKAMTDKTIVSVDHIDGLTNRPHFDAAIAKAGLKIIQPKV